MWRAILSGVVAAVLASSALGQTTKPAMMETVAAGKRATALLLIGGTRSSASAFCIDPTGYFITSAHAVIRGTGGLTLVMASGEPDEARLAATVVRTDEKADLALLSTTSEGKLPYLPLGSCDGLFETQELSAYGYPFGRLLGTRGASTPNRASNPNITVSTGRVTSLRKQDGKLQLIQLDAALNPGNSGGPVLDESGKVVGIVASGIYGAVINFAVPVSTLWDFLATPEVTVQVPNEVSAADATKPIDMSVRVVLMDILKIAPEVSAALTAGDGEERKLALKGGAGGLFTCSFAPVAHKPGPSDVLVTAVFAKGQIQGRMVDGPVVAGTHKFKLSDIALVERGAAPKITTLRGESVAATIRELDAARVIMDDQAVLVNLNKASRVELRVPPPPTGVNYKILVASGGKVLCERPGRIAITSSGGVGGGKPTSLPAALEITSTKITGTIEKKLPDIVADIVPAAGGRLLVMHMPKTRKLAIFDVMKGEVVKYLPVDAETVFYAGGRDKLVVILPDKDVFQRYDLATFDREIAATVPGQEGVTGIVMGCQSTENALLLGRQTASLLNIYTLARTSLKSVRGEQLFTFGNSDGSNVRVSCDGSVYGTWQKGTSPSGVNSIIISGSGMVRHYNEHNTRGYVVPSPDGSYIFTQRGLFTCELQAVSEGKELTVLPSYQMPFYLILTSSNVYSSGESRSRDIGICVLGDGRSLLTQSCPELASTDAIRAVSSAQDKLTLDKRVHYVPQADVLVTLPVTNDRLVLRRVDLLEQLGKNDVDYLFVASSAPPVATSGSLYRYQVKVHCRKGPPQFFLDSAPEGMTISPSGEITWQVPDSGPKDTTIIVRAKDQVNQETFHSFRLRVE